MQPPTLLAKDNLLFVKVDGYTDVRMLKKIGQNSLSKDTSI